MSEVKQNSDTSGRIVAEVVAEHGPLSEDELVDVVMLKEAEAGNDAPVEDVMEMIRFAMMNGWVYQNADNRYCQTGWWDEPGWEPGDQ